jgi:hypothetical protein
MLQQLPAAGLQCNVGCPKLHDPAALAKNVRAILF